MANISVTYTFSNSTTADAGEVNTNFQDIIDGTSDGTKDFSINALTCAGTATLNGNVNLGNATSDDVTITGRIASDLDPKTAASNTLGDATQTWQALYLDNTVTDGGAIYFDGGSSKYLKSDAAGANLDIVGFTSLDLGTAEIKTMGLYDEAKSADYTVTDTDGVSVIYMTAGSSADKVVTLPTAADNAGRVITVKKVDSGTKIVYLDGEGAETIDGQTGNTAACAVQYEFVTVQCDGTAWHIINRSGASKWQTYTPTTSALDISSVTMEYRRVGDSIEIRGEFTTGTVGGTEAQIGLPSGLTISGSVSDVLHCGTLHRDATTSLAINLIRAQSGDSFLTLAANSDGNTNNLLEPTGDGGSAVVASSERVTIQAGPIPITQFV